MQKTKLLIALLGSLGTLQAFAADAPAPAPAFTPSANVAIVSNYLYRGISQTGASPAIQGGFDLAHASGAYAGVWGSSITWVSDADTSAATSAGTELDTYAGYKGTAGSIGYDVGYLRYNYPGTYPTGATKPDTDELYVAATYSIVTAKVSYALGDTFGVKDAKGTTYFDLSASYPVGETGYTLGAHYGVQTYNGYDKAVYTNDPSYSDYRVSVSKDFSGYALGLTLSSTNAKEAFYTDTKGKFLGRSAAVVSLSRAF